MQGAQHEYRKESGKEEGVFGQSARNFMELEHWMMLRKQGKISPQKENSYI